MSASPRKPDSIFQNEQSDMFNGNITVFQALEIITKLFQKHDLVNPREDAQQIIAHYLQIPLLELNLHRERLLSDEECLLISRSVKRRCLHEPLQYIFGHVCFMGYDFLVDRSVLIPRKETELLVEKIYSDHKNSAAKKTVLDIGTGSGVIAISLAKLLPEWRIEASDYSAAALSVARKNNVRNRVEIQFFHSDLFKSIDKSYDVIVSNPPYIAEQEYKTLSRQIRLYEPEEALLAAESGCYYYRRILQEALMYLNPGGLIYLELGYNQADMIRSIAEQLNYRIIDILRDYQQIERIAKLTPESFLH